MKPNTDTIFTEKADHNKIERNRTFWIVEFRFKAEKNHVWEIRSQETIGSSGQIAFHVILWRNHGIFKMLYLHNEKQ